MGWSAEFLEALKDRIHTPQFYLEVSKEAGNPGATGAVFHSHHGVYYKEGEHTISRDSVRVSSGSISVLSWSQSFGGLVVGIHGGNDEATTILQSVVRGSLVRLYCGFEGWRSANYQPIFTGQVRQLRGNPQRGYSLECWDIVRALGSRWTTTSNQAALFFNLDQDVSAATTVKTGTSYTAASGGPLDVTSASAFEREDSANYLLRATPSGGSAFYIRATGLTGTQFTGLTGGVYDTTDEDLAAGDKIEHLALLQDGPIDIVKKLLLSTGTTGAAHSTYDKYPAGWGFAVPRDWVDLADIDDIMSRYQVDTTWNLDVVVTEQQTNPINWLQGVIGKCGFWLVHRQGEISMRPAQNPLLSTIPGDFHITDSEIESVMDWQAWDGSRSLDYVSLKVSDMLDYSVTSSEAITTLPSSQTYEVTLDDLWDGTGNQNQDGVADVDTRTEIWAHRIPERVSLTMCGLRYAGLCEGDIGRITSGVVPSRDSAGTASRPCMVISCAPDWLGGVVRLDLSIPAEWAGEFPT